MLIKYVLLLMLCFFELAVSNDSNSLEFSPETMTAFFGVTNDVLASGILDVGKMFAPPMLSAALEIAKVIPNVIKGLVPATDPNIQNLKELSEKFTAKIDQAEENIKEELHSLKLELVLEKFMDKIKIGADFLMKKSHDILKYNSSLADVDAYTNFCRYNTDSAPDKLIAIINHELVRDCGSMDDYQKKNYVKALENVKDLDIRLELKFRIAYITAKEGDSTIYKEIIEKEKSFKSTLEFDKWIVMFLKQNDIFSAICPLDLAFYGKTCSRYNLSSTISAINNIMNDIWIGSVICSSFYVSPLDAALTKNFNTFKNYSAAMDRYFEKTMEDSYQLCDSALINDSIKTYPEPLRIEDRNYQDFGDFILRRLQNDGNPNLDRKIVVTKPFTFNSQYFCKCENMTLCKSFEDLDRNVLIFQLVSSIKDEQDYELRRHRKYFVEHEKEINQTIKDKQDVIQLSQMIGFLKERNLSLSAPDRFTKQLWIRDWNLFGSCKFTSTISFKQTFQETSKYLDFYFPNYGPTTASECYHIYIVF